MFTSSVHLASVHVSTVSLQGWLDEGKLNQLHRDGVKYARYHHHTLTLTLTPIPTPDSITTTKPPTLTANLPLLRVPLADNDVYFLPRNIIHQFRTVSATCSVGGEITCC